MNRLKLIASKYPYLGAAIYVTSVQYFIVQLVVSLRFTPSYSWYLNAISDLGNSACGEYANKPICSPLHPIMNLSFVVLGLAIILGSGLLYYAFNRTKLIALGWSLFGLGGIGVIIVGLFPENTIAVAHSFGASMPFLLGNVGLIVLGICLKVSRPIRLFTVFTGAVALIALIFYTAGQYLGLGNGGIERVVAYPQTIWMIVFGLHCIKNGSRRG